MLLLILASLIDFFWPNDVFWSQEVCSFHGSDGTIAEKSLQDRRTCCEVEEWRIQSNKQLVLLVYTYIRVQTYFRYLYVYLTVQMHKVLLNLCFDVKISSKQIDWHIGLSLSLSANRLLSFVVAEIRKKVNYKFHIYFMHDLLSLLHMSHGVRHGGGARGAMPPPQERIGGASNAFGPPQFFGKVLL